LKDTIEEKDKIRKTTEAEGEGWIPFVIDKQRRKTKADHRIAINSLFFLFLLLINLVYLLICLLYGI